MLRLLPAAAREKQHKWLHDPENFAKTIILHLKELVIEPAQLEKTSQILFKGFEALTRWFLH